MSSQVHAKISLAYLNVDAHLNDSPCALANSNKKKLYNNRDTYTVARTRSE